MSRYCSGVNANNNPVLSLIISSAVFTQRVSAEIRLSLPSSVSGILAVWTLPSSICVTEMMHWSWISFPSLMIAEVLVPNICAAGMIPFMNEARSTASSAVWTAVCIRISTSLSSPSSTISWLNVSSRRFFETYKRFQVNMRPSPLLHFNTARP